MEYSIDLFENEHYGKAYARLEQMFEKNNNKRQTEYVRWSAFYDDMDEWVTNKFSCKVEAPTTYENDHSDQYIIYFKTPEELALFKLEWL